MNAENDRFLCENHPILYSQRRLGINTSCMAWGFEHGDGWMDIVATLSERLEAINDLPFGIGGRVEAAQVKEKFASLRFYYDHTPFGSNILGWGIGKITFCWSIIVGLGLGACNVAVFGSGDPSWMIGHPFVAMLAIPTSICLVARYSSAALKWFYSRKIRRLVSDAEEESGRTCEACGKPGKINDGGWLSCRCDDCRATKQHGTADNLPS